MAPDPDFEGAVVDVVQAVDMAIAARADTEAARRRWRRRPNMANAVDFDEHLQFEAAVLHELLRAWNRFVGLLERAP